LHAKASACSSPLPRSGQILFARLEGLKPLQIVNPGYPDRGDSDMKAEMQAEMEADGAEI
jgi:hypothetical protein